MSPPYDPEQSKLDVWNLHADRLASSQGNDVGITLRSHTGLIAQEVNFSTESVSQNEEAAAGLHMRGMIFTLRPMSGMRSEVFLT